MLPGPGALTQEHLLGSLEWGRTVLRALADSARPGGPWLGRAKRKETEGKFELPSFPHCLHGHPPCALISGHADLGGRSLSRHATSGPYRFSPNVHSLPVLISLRGPSRPTNSVHMAKVPPTLLLWVLANQSNFPPRKALMWGTVTFPTRPDGSVRA